MCGFNACLEIERRPTIFRTFPINECDSIRRPNCYEHGEGRHEYRVRRRLHENVTRVCSYEG